MAVEDVSNLRLDAFVECARSLKLDKYERYFRAKQYDHRKYNWDGKVIPPEGQEADIEPGWFVPLAGRRPSTRIHQARKIVTRFTAMTLGGERFAKINVHGDDEAEDWCQELVRVSRLESKMVEARNNGGACGTAVVSWCFVEGKPRVNVHAAQRCFVLRWADRDERRPAQVLESYRYKRTVIEEGKPKEKEFFYARLWTQDEERIWDPIPVDLARDGTWAAVVSSTAVQHGFGFCPVYWVQNLPDGENDDGESDYEGQIDNFDAMSTVASQITKGTNGNVDPTMVIKDDPNNNVGSVRKGSENAIYSKNGADYMTLPGDAFQAGIEWLREMRNESSETSNIVFPSPDELSGAKSAAALRVLYGPMLTQCDTYRTQYGKAIEAIVRDMLEVSREVFGTEGGEVFVTPEGQRVQTLPTIELEDRIVEERSEETGETKQITKKRSPGKSTNVVLNWPPYFPDTWADIALAVEAGSKATGGKAILSQETAVKNIGPKFGALNAEEELERIHEDEEQIAERQNAQMNEQLKAEALYGSNAIAAQGAPKGKSDDE